MAVATPAILPVPTVAERATIRASKLEMSPWAFLSGVLRTMRVNAWIR